VIEEEKSGVKRKKEDQPREKNGEPGEKCLVYIRARMLPCDWAPDGVKRMAWTAIRYPFMKAVRELYLDNG
jgi:hypothetical protein